MPARPWSALSATSCLKHVQEQTPPPPCVHSSVLSPAVCRIQSSTLPGTVTPPPP